MIKLNIARWESALSIFFLFVNYWYGVVTIFIPAISLSQLVISVDIFALVVLFLGLGKKKITLSKNGWYTIFFAIAIIILYLSTGFRYWEENDIYITHLLVLISETLVAVILACTVACNRNAQIVIKRVLPCIGLVFTIVAIYSMVFATGTMGGNWIYNENGMNYQVISYMSAFATGMFVFYLLEYKEIEWFIFFKNKCGYVIAVISLVVNAYTTLVSGGRGGFVVYIFFILYYILYWIKESKATASMITKRLFFFLILPIVGVYIINIAINSGISASGINRIIDIDFLTSLAGRNALYREVVDLVGKKPIVGYGVGSTFFELGIWTHNLFLDVLLETGFVGIIVVICILLKGFVSARMLQKQDKTNRIWAMLFYMGLLFSMVSGYYLANILLVWCSAFWFGYRSYNRFSE